MISTWIWRFSRGSMIYGWSLWIITLIDQGWNWLKLWTKFPRAYEVTFNGSIVDAVSKSIRHKFAINTTNIVNMGTWFKFIGSSYRKKGDDLTIKGCMHLSIPSYCYDGQKVSDCSFFEIQTDLIYRNPFHFDAMKYIFISCQVV